MEGPQYSRVNGSVQRNNTISEIGKERLRILRYVEIVPEERTIRKVLKNIPEKRCIRKPRNRWLYGDENDLKKMEVRYLRKIARDTGVRKLILKEVRLLPGT